MLLVKGLTNDHRAPAPLFASIIRIDWPEPVPWSARYTLGERIVGPLDLSLDEPISPCGRSTPGRFAEQVLGGMRSACVLVAKRPTRKAEPLASHKVFAEGPLITP